MMVIKRTGVQLITKSTDCAASKCLLQRPLIVRFTSSDIGEVVKGDTQSLYLYGRATHQTRSVHIYQAFYLYTIHITLT